MNWKTAVMHRPPGDEENQHIICIGNPVVPVHLRYQNDFIVCEGE